MKKFFYFIATAIALLSFSACKKSSTPTDTSTITLSFNSVTYASINSCNVDAGAKGSPNAMSFTVSDPGNKMTAGNWSLMEQVGSNPAVTTGGSVKSGNIVTFTGCIRFGTVSTAVIKYFITTTSGINSNTVEVTYTRPAGAN